MNKQKDEEGMQVSCTLSSKGWTLNLNGSEQESSKKELTWLF